MRALLILFLGSLLVVPVSLQAAQRTFVASSGNDANACGLGSPCRSFSRALTVTDDRGEIIVLDSAGYGVINAINQSVAIIAPPGVYAGISVLGSSNGIYINSGDVTLRGLTINGQTPASLDGIFVFDAGVVHIDRCVISNMAGAGIRVAPGSGTPTVHVTHSEIRSNFLYGIWVQAGSNSKLLVSDTLVTRNAYGGVLVQAGHATLDRVTVEFNDDGIRLMPTGGGLVQALMRDVTLARNVSYGLILYGNSSAKVLATCERCASFGNTKSGFYTTSDPTAAVGLTLFQSVASENLENGIDAAEGSIFVSGSASTQNTGYGLHTNGLGKIETAGNNFVRENGAGNQFGIVVNVGTL